MAPILLVEIISALVGLVCLGALTVRFICVRLNRTQGSGAGRERARRHAAWGVGLVAAAAVHGASATLYVHRARMLERTRAAGRPLPASFSVP